MRTFIRAGMESLRLGDGRNSRRGDSCRDQGPTAVWRGLCRRLSGPPISHLMTYWPTPNLFWMSLACISKRAPAKRLRPPCSPHLLTTDARSGHVEVDRRHECRRGSLANLASSGVQRPERSSSWARLRRRCEHHAGAHPCLCDEIADVLLDPKPIACDCACRRTGFELSEASYSPSCSCCASVPVISTVDSRQSQPSAQILGRRCACAHRRDYSASFCRVHLRAGEGED